MATVNIIQLVAPIQLATDGAPVYTAPTQTTAKISRAVFTNTTGSSVTITAGIVPSGSGLSAAQTMISAFALAAGAAYVSPELAGAVLPSGYQLFANSNTASAVTFTASGVTIQ